MSLLIMIMATIVGLAGCSDKSSGESKNSDGSVTLSIAMKDEGPSNPNAVSFFEQLSKNIKKDEGIKVKFELVELPQGSYSEKLNLKLSSGDIPDLIYFQGGDLPFQQQGLMEDLTPYIEKSRYIKNIMEPHNKERMKNYPYLLWIKPLSPSVPVIRKELLTQLKSSKALMENPSVENYYEFFKELKQSGKANLAYAITTSGTISELDFIFDEAFGNTSTWLEEDGKYVYKRVSNNEKNKLAFYHKLYKEGLLDPEYATKKWDTKEKAFYDGKAGVIVGTAGKVIDIYDGKMKKVQSEKAALELLPPAKGVSQGFGATDVTKEPRGMAISSQSKNKEIAFKVLDYLGSPNGQKLDRLGIKDTHYKQVEEQIELTSQSQEWYARFWEPTKTELTEELKTPLLGPAAQKSLDYAFKYYEEDKNFILPAEYTPMWDTTENLYKEFAVDIITGKRSINEFDVFVKQWYKNGGEEITTYANKELK